MSIQKSIKWIALAGLGFLVSGCVAAPTAYSPSNASYSQTAPGTFVADPSYPGGGYYEVVDVYEDPSYYYGPPVPRYYGPTGVFGTSLYIQSHSGKRHRHDHGEKAHSDHLKKKGKGSKRKAKKKNGKKNAEQRVLTDEQLAAREERRARRQACRDSGHKDCKALRRAERRAAKQEAAFVEAASKKNRKIRPANKRKGKRKEN